MLLEVVKMSSSEEVDLGDVSLSLWLLLSVLGSDRVLTRTAPSPQTLTTSGRP
jgi:hypothetical protein